MYAYELNLSSQNGLDIQKIFRNTYFSFESILISISPKMRTVVKQSIFHHAECPVCVEAGMDGDSSD